jgi:hypothetical protein
MRGENMETKYKDFLGNEIKPGCVLAYPRRAGARMWIETMRVERIDPPQGKGRSRKPARAVGPRTTSGEDGPIVRVESFDRSIVVSPPCTVAMVRGCMIKAPPGFEFVDPSTAQPGDFGWFLGCEGYQGHAKDAERRSAEDRWYPWEVQSPTLEEMKLFPSEYLCLRKLPA